MSGVRPGIHHLFLRDDDLDQAREWLLLADRALARALEPLLRDTGLSRAQLRAAFLIARRPGVSLREHGAALGLTKQSASRLFQDLERRGYVTQEVGRNDRRARAYALTERGQALHQRVAAAERAIVARAYRGAGAASVEGFRRVLAVLTPTWEPLGERSHADAAASDGERT